MSEPPQIIFNTSLLTAFVPERFKLATAIPVFKKGSRVSLSNYRPFKLLEKFEFSKLSDYLEERYLIYSKQFGFRSHHSTDHAVSSIIIKFPYNARSDWLKQRALSENRVLVDDVKLTFKFLLQSFDKFDPN